MGALPKRKPSTRRKGKRRTQIKLKTQKLITCKQCQAKKLPHQVCPECGTYQ